MMAEFDRGPFLGIWEALYLGIFGQSLQRKDAGQLANPLFCS
jgi:hypothetical protein